MATWLVSWCLSVAACATGEVREEDGFVRRESAHYDLRVEGPPELAAEIEAVLEQSWPRFAAFYGGEPRLAKGERLGFSLYASRESWERGILGDRTRQPSMVDRAYFSPKSKKVYVYRDPIDHVTRAHSIYAAYLQFHGLAKAKNIDLDRAWYVHGIAEMFAEHTWHDGVLEVLVRRRMSVIDPAAEALRALRASPKLWSHEQLALSGVRWAAVSFASDRHPAELSKLALGATGSKMSGEDFQRSLGPKDVVGKEFWSWLEGAQVPFEVLTWGFAELDGGRFLGEPKEGELALCRLKQTPDWFEARIPVGASRKGSGGLLVGWKPPAEATIVRFGERSAFLERYVEGARVEDQELGTPPAQGGFVRARVVRAAPGAGGGVALVEVHVGDAIVHEMPIEHVAFGLAAHTADVVFDEVGWKPATAR